MNMTHEFSELAAKLKEYASTEFEIMKLRLVEKCSGILSELFSYVLVLQFSLLLVIFSALTLAVLIWQTTGDLLLSASLITGIFFLVFGLYLLFFRKLLLTRMQNLLVRKMLEGQ